MHGSHNACYTFLLSLAVHCEFRTLLYATRFRTLSKRTYIVGVASSCRSSIRNLVLVGLGCSITARPGSVLSEGTQIRVCARRHDQDDIAARVLHHGRSTRTTSFPLCCVFASCIQVSRLHFTSVLSAGSVW